MSFLKILRQAIALVLIYALPVATCPVEASVSPHWQQQQQSTAAAPEPSPKISNEQLDSLVAPIALYPDGLLAQILVASTYPLEIIQLQQWLDRNQGLKDQALRDAVDKQNWDASVEGLAPMPDVVKILSENIKWTTDLGNAFLAQQNDVMDAVQRMRMKAKNSGQLKTTEQQKVETKVVEEKTVVVIEPSNPEVIYVPSYDPMVVYGAPAYAYPYPPMYYPPGYYAAGMALSFGVGLAVGAAWGGCCGWGCGWGGGNNIYINNNNNFINHYNQNNLKRQNISGNRPSTLPSGKSNWQHNPDHRGGAPYGNRETANKFGGTARGDSMANRQASAKQNMGRGGWQQAGMRDGGSMGGRGTDRGGVSTMDRGAGSFGGSGDRVGSRDVSRGSGSGAFGGASSGMSNRSAGASQSRGSSSMGSRGGSSGGRSAGGGRSGGGRRR